MKKQKLFLDAQKKQLVKNYDLQQKEDQVNQKVVVKLFNPTGLGTWYLTELNEVDNVAFGLRINGFAGNYDEEIERALVQSALWDEVKDRLKDNAFSLSGGQQQRLCIARALAIRPDVILLDEPTSALDPIATVKIEDLVNVLKKDYTIIIVTHNMQQAARVSDKTAFLLSGEDRCGALVEYDYTQNIFSNPKMKQTEDYITGRFS